MFKRWRGFPLQLFLFIILPLTILLMGITFSSLALHQRAMRTLVGERDERATRAAAAAIAEQLNHRAATVHSLVLQASATGNPQQTLDNASMFFADFEGGLVFFSSDGALLVASKDAHIWSSLDLDQAVAGSGLADESRHDADFLPLAVDSGTGESLMLVSARAPDGLLIVGAFSPAAVARRSLANIFGASEMSAAYLVNSEGHMIYQLGVDQHAATEPIRYPGVQEALRGESGTTYISVGGDENVIAFSPVALVDWALVFEEPWRAVADPILRTTELIPLALVPVLFIALLGLWFGVRQIVQPLQQLEQKATELAWGNFEAIEEPVGGVTEIQRLQTELIHMAHKVRAAQQRLRGYLGAVTMGQEEERGRLARELHDDTIQSLIALNQQVQLAQMAVKNQQALGQLSEMQRMTIQVIADLRRLTRDLRPIYLEDLGLIPALDMLVRDTSSSMNIPVRFEVNGPERRLDPEIELALYRMVQEALSNVARHAEALSAVVSLDFGSDNVTLSVSDDGRGFRVPESPAEMAPEGHYGLLGMQERAELIGGRLIVESGMGQGTHVRVVLPNQLRPS